MANPWTHALHEHSAEIIRELAPGGKGEILSVSKYAPLFILQIIASLLSVFASIVVVRISTPKLDSTYQRLIFLLNIALVVNSIFFALHPLLVPNDGNGAYWAVGNLVSCSMVGFFLVFGSLAVSMYHTGIAVHFYVSAQKLCRDYYTNHPVGQKTLSSLKDNFGPEVEVLSKIICAFLPLVLAGTAAALDSCGYDPSVGLCTVYGLDSTGSISTNNDDETTLSWRVLRNIFRWTLVASGTVTVAMTAMTMYRVSSFRMKLCYSKPEGDNDCGLGEADANVEEQERQITGQKLKALSKQCLYYTGAYLTSYVWFIALLFLSTDGDNANSNSLYAFRFLTVLFYPLLGVFNCTIYVLPRMQMLEIMYPQDSFWVGIRVAMSKAGDPRGIESVRAKIYGSEYSGSHDRTPAEACEDASGVASGESGDNDTVSSLRIPRVVSFDPTSPISVRSMVTVGDEDEKNEEHEHLSP